MIETEQVRRRWRSAFATASTLSSDMLNEQLDGHHVSDHKEPDLSTVENKEESSADSAEHSPASTTRRVRSQRRRISQDEAREIARLYAEDSASTAELRQRFGIGESSLYRVVQQHGVALRGRTGSGSQSKPSGAKAAVDARSRLSARAAATRGSARTSKGSMSGPALRVIAASTKKMPVGRASSRTGGGAQRRYEIRFQAERVFEATDIRDALRQAESVGATDITAIARD